MYREHTIMGNEESFPDVPQAIAQFAQILRRLGVRVSIAETVDAYNGLAHVDLLDKHQVKTSLRALLVKNPHDWLIFNRAFELFFLPEEARQDCLNFYREQKEEEEQKLTEARQELAQMLQPWQEHLHQHQLTEENIRTFARLPVAEQKRLKEIVAQMRGNPVNNPGELIVQVVLSALNYWRYYLLKKEAEASEVHLPENLLAYDACFYRDPKEQILYADMQNIKDENLPKMTALIQQLSSRLATRLSRRYQRSHRAQAIDIRRTIRQNIRYGGTPLELRYRARRAKRPRLILVCDVSASMARYARFVIPFIYGLSSVVREIESFIFSEDLERITSYFESRRDFAETMAVIMNESKQWGRTTNFSVALKTFLHEYKNLVEHNSILIIVSDTKTLFWEEAARLLADLSRKMKEIIWLNPVPAKQWHTLPAVAAFQQSARMEECYSLFHLEKILRKKMG